MGNNGTLVVDRGGWDVIPEKKKGKDLMEKIDFKEGTGKGLDLHMANFADGVRNRNRDLNANIVVAATRQFTNDDAANKYLVPAYRSPWVLPKI